MMQSEQWRVKTCSSFTIHSSSFTTLAPLRELFGEGAFFAVGEIFQAEVVIELEKGLLVGEAAHERGCGFFISEEADGGAFEFLVGGGVTEFVVIFKSESLLVDGEGDEMVCGKLQGEVFPEHGNGGMASGGGEGVVMRPEIVAQAVEKIDQRFGGKRSGEGDLAEGGPLFDQCGKSADPAVRVVGGALAVGFPAGGLIS